MPTDPNELVALAKKGDKDAFGEIYQLFLSRIYRFIYYLVYDESLAEDITQETFIKAWKAMSSFSLSKGTVQSFLFTIARNLVIDNQRKKKAVPLDGEVAQNIEAEENLEEHILEKETKDEIRSALSKLEPFEKQIVILRYFEELSYQEIATVVRKKEGAIRVRLHRSLSKLKEIMKGKK